MLFGPRSRSLIGLDITTSSIKLVELSQSGKTYRAESYAAEPTPPNSINEKTMLRVSTGLFHNRVTLNDSTVLGGNPPFQPMVTVANGIADNPGGIPEPCRKRR